MNWLRLLSTVRLGRGPASASDPRSEFQRDYDRIVYSSAFRRLQDKTQVFSLPENDFVRTRLTHSLEVSCVGRSLGTLIGDRVCRRDAELPAGAHEFGWIVAAASLAHDIGNPPFGHAGEEAIRQWFLGRGARYIADLEPNQRADFEQFEGNAQGFRVLCRLQNAVDRGGLQLTCAVLGTFAKYPRPAMLSARAEPERISAKKSGFCVADAPLFRTVANETGLLQRENDVWARHPLAFLMEAADDICYSVVDVEDGYRLGILSFDEAKDLLEPIAFAAQVVPTTDSYRELTRDDGRVAYLRARAINRLVDTVSRAFIDREAEIMCGDFDRDLVSETVHGSDVGLIRRVSHERIYVAAHREHESSVAQRIVGALLDRLVPGTLDPAPREHEERIRVGELLPEQFRPTQGTPYEKLLAVTDYVSGMTDSFAVRWATRRIDDASAGVTPDAQAQVPSRAVD